MPLTALIDEAKQQKKKIQASEPDEKTDSCYETDTDTHHKEFNTAIKYFAE